MKKEIVCKMCGEKFIGWHNAKFCDDCKIIANRIRTARAAKRKKLKQNDEIGITVRKCMRCGKQFVIENSRQFFCLECRPLHTAEMQRKKQSKRWHEDEDFRERKKRYLKKYQKEYQRQYYRKKIAQRETAEKRKNTDI